MNAHTVGLPLSVGVGLKSVHFEAIFTAPPQVGFFEIHAENYMVPGGPAHYYLQKICADYPLSIHGVGLSIGAEGDLDVAHLRALRELLERYQPASFSEHLAWSSHTDIFLNDLLPIPYTAQTLQRVCDHIDQTQSFLGRKMLLENPATYIEFVASTIDEPAFIAEVVKRTGCGLLLDVNNIYVSCTNHHRSPHEYLRALPLAAVGEIHLAGFAEQVDGNGAPLLIDHHGAAVANDVWDLYDFTIGLTGPIATLIERDNDIPSYEVLVAEARRAQGYLDQHVQDAQHVQHAVAMV